MTPIRFSWVGSGRIVAKHIEALTALPEANVVAYAIPKRSARLFMGRNEVSLCMDSHSIGRSHFSSYSAGLPLS
jgi:hypothetical protein